MAYGDVNDLVLSLLPELGTVGSKWGGVGVTRAATSSSNVRGPRFTRGDFRAISRWLIPIAVENPNSVFLVGTVLTELRHRQILHPAIMVVERVVATAEAYADKRVFSLINGRLTGGHRNTLDAWLSVTPHESRSRLSWIRKPIGRPSPSNVIGILDRLSAINDCALPSTLIDDLPVTRRDRLAREGNRIAVHNLRAFSPSRRYAVMAVALLELRRSLIDEAISMHDRIVGGLIRRSKRKHAEELQTEAKQIREAIGALALLGRALLSAKETGCDAWQAIEHVMTWDVLEMTTQQAETLSGPRKLNHLYFVDAQYPQIRRYSPALLEHFGFRTAAAGRDVLHAVRLLRELNVSGKRKLPPDAPTSFITAQWSPFVHQEDGIDRRYYELCVLSELRNRLRSGDVWVPGSRQYQDFEGYLLGKGVFQELKDEGSLPVAVKTDGAAYLSDRISLLEGRLDEVHALVQHGALQDIQIKDGRFSVSPNRASAIPAEAKNILKAIYAQLPRIKITDLLVEVDGWTGFTEQFRHIRTDRVINDKQSVSAP